MCVCFESSLFLFRKFAHLSIESAFHGLFLQERQNCRISRTGANGRCAIGIARKIASGGAARGMFAEAPYLG